MHELGWMEFIVSSNSRRVTSKILIKEAILPYLIFEFLLSMHQFYCHHDQHLFIMSAMT